MSLNSTALGSLQAFLAAKTFLILMSSKIRPTKKMTVTTPPPMKIAVLGVEELVSADY